MTLDEWDAMPEDKNLELVDGVLHVVAAAVPPHQKAQSRLVYWLDEQLPPSLVAYHDVDVTIDSSNRPTVRKPDITVGTAEAADSNPKRFDVKDVVLAVEIVSPGSERVDRVTKPTQYAKAGIANYWLVELGTPISLTAFELVDGVYKLVEDGVGQVELTRPAPLAFDLDALTRRR
ncbi:Uma2 family endonuclease [Lentzea flaviverrucosa]|uniref:Endonuclease, Uma2 family (Restriction endonuclease fold) n=1 Tax=Lentzea flaviverrucosa TaxID=200379 RepID=A0A1H9US07_9PSEU|nr:Uma2 family endonuclease [Lentzea flaviverrucosa]SES12176.1 Endonuclease, Uma2 family (restriction endonuclease fold) [Lentzea flaviverrucosa]